MSKNLVIVESPAKAKTLENFLGKDYKVVSSYGHIADLPSKDIGVNLESFEPNYIVSDDKKRVVKELKQQVDKSDMIWLASDEDREGEAIAWHLHQQLKLDNKTTKRIVFNSITKSAVLNAIENPRNINQHLVDAQQARRVLDRLVGYELSPILWKKVKRGLSAGRVQSVAVRLIVERERSIENHKSKSSYKITAEFSTSENKKFKTTIKENIESEEKAISFLNENKEASFVIQKLEKKFSKRTPSAPFITSTLQQEASRKLGFSVSKTMTVAQRLYESGYITYMRTDSNNLSQEAINQAKNTIKKNYGSQYSNPRKYTTKSKGAQEAHEAIRPTDFMAMKAGNDRDQMRLYEFIWKRTIASQMSDAEIEVTNVTVSADTHDKKFITKGEIIKFDGFLKVYLEGKDEEDEEEDNTSVMLPPLKEGQSLNCNYIEAVERFSKPPARYTEASLVKQLEKIGVGRPSTYAPTISTIQNRGYVEKGTNTGSERKYKRHKLKNSKLEHMVAIETIGGNKGKMVPTHIGRVVNDFLVEYFERILDFNFTAQVEKSFDHIASGDEKWKSVIKSFYQGFHSTVKHVEETAERQSGERILGKDSKTNKTVLVRLARFGPVVQLGTQEENKDDDEVSYAGLLPYQSMEKITIEEALTLFELPRQLGEYKELPIEINSGRYGPYVKYDGKYISLPKKDEIFSITKNEAIELIIEKEKADAPIGIYQGIDVQKGVGRFGPFIKWNGMFINVSKKYDFDNLTQEDIEALIEDKLKKERDKIIHNWKKEGIRIEKARWKRHVIIKGKTKIELPKEVDVTNMTLEEAKKRLSKVIPKKSKTSRK